jgi:hypothetical protein
LAGRKPATALLRDLQDLWLMVNESIVSTAVLLQAVRALADRELEHDLATIESRNERQHVWLLSRIRQAGLRRSRSRRDVCNCPQLANASLCSENLQIVQCGGGAHPVNVQFNISDHVSWNSEAGRVSGTIIGVRTSDFDCKGLHALRFRTIWNTKSKAAEPIMLLPAKAGL